MNPVMYLNAILGTGLAIIIIFIDYTRKHYTDKFQRPIFLVMLGVFLLAAAADLAGVYADYENTNTGILPQTADSLLPVLRTTGYWLAFIFADYFAHGNQGRTKRILYPVILIPLITGILVLLDLRQDYNAEIPLLMVGYLPLLLCAADMILAARQSKQTSIFQLVFFGMLTGLGSVPDMIFGTSGIAWLCFTAAVLYTYFNIIRMDLKIDALTGIGNRYSFNEFIGKLSGRSISRRMFREHWAVVMIDMNHFKEINDTLGHMEGDNALRDMAKIIKGCIRRSDFAARYGGDEFVLAARAETNIEKLIARLRRELDLHNETAGRSYKLDISYGYDIFDTGGSQTIDGFLAHIDALMYNHKAQNRRYSDRVENQET